MGHIFEYATVRIPSRSATKITRREGIKATRRTADLQLLTDNPDLRCHVASRMSLLLPPISIGTFISQIAAI